MPLAVLLVITPVTFRPPTLAPVAVFVSFCLRVTFSTVLFEPMHQLVLQLDVDPPPGLHRHQAFAVEALSAPRPASGYSNTQGTDHEAEAIIRIISTGMARHRYARHNGYLDIALSWGSGAHLCYFRHHRVPLVNYARCRPVQENLLLADFF